MNKMDMKALQKSYDKQRSEVKPASRKPDRELEPAADTRIRVNLSIPHQLDDCLISISESLGVTKSEVALMAIRQALPGLLSIVQASDKLRSE
jgi:hypothetical protein